MSDNYAESPEKALERSGMEGYRKMPKVRYNVDRILYHQGFLMSHLARVIGRQQSALVRTLDGNPSVRVLQTVAWALGIDPMYLVMQTDNLETHLSAGLIRFSSRPPICKGVRHVGKQSPKFRQFKDETPAERIGRHFTHTRNLAHKKEDHLRSVPGAPPSDAEDAQIQMRKDAHAYAPPGSGITAEQQMQYASDNNHPGQPAPWNQDSNPQAGGAQTDPQAAQGPTDAQDQVEPSNLEALETALADWEEGTQGPANQPEGTPSTDDDDRIDKSVGAGSAIPFADPSQLEDDIAATAEAERQRYAFDPSVGVDHLGTPLDLPAGWAMAPDATHSFHDYRAVGWLWRQMVDHGVVTPTEQQ